MALDPLCLCFFSICIITCWRCFLPFRLAIPIMPYPLYVVTLKTKIKNEIEDNTTADMNISKISGDSKKNSDVIGSKTEKTMNSNQVCYTDYEEYSKGDYFNYKVCNGSLVGNIFSNPQVNNVIEIIKTEDMHNANIQGRNTENDTNYYSNRETKNDNINASTNTCSSSTETLTKSRNLKICEYKWVRTKKSELCDLASKGRSYLKKCTQKLRIKNTIVYRNRK